MENIFSTEVKAYGLVDLAILTASKVVSERALMPIVGNGTLKSGAIKAIGGALGHNFLPGKFKLGADGVLIDGMEDIVQAFVNGTAFGNSGNQGADW